MRFLALAVLAALPLDHAISRDARVDVRTFQFAPDTLRVKLGARVFWTNQDEIEHTVTAGVPGRRDRTFDALLQTKGSVASHTFSGPGTFTYFCDRHQFMRGSITVTR